ncbi:hypothetical protein [Dokdonella sp.]|uniref:hypothetical protein n=1 Tax=Dokdonella sp. TaxID=2291710 RepID=UPI0035270273
MTINKGVTPLRRIAALSAAWLGLLIASFALPAVAAPGDHPVDPHSAQSAQADQPAGTLFGYLWIAGSTFHPLDNATTYSYPGNGCISKTGGTDNRFAHKVVLPEGTLVRYLRLYYFDDSTGTVTAYFTSYDGAGNFVEHASVGSSNGAGGYGTSLSPLFSYEVDPFGAAINVVANLGDQNTSTLRFCGVRIAYDAPITDRIFADDFDPIPL